MLFRSENFKKQPQVGKSWPCISTNGSERMSHDSLPRRCRIRRVFWITIHSGSGSKCTILTAVSLPTGCLTGTLGASSPSTTEQPRSPFTIANLVAAFAAICTNSGLKDRPSMRIRAAKI